MHGSHNYRACYRQGRGSFRASLELSGLGPNQPVVWEYVGGSTYNCTHGIIVRAGVARRGRRLGRLRTAGLFMPAAEEGIKGLGHDVRCARAAISAGPGGMIAGPALRGRHDRGPRGRIEGVTIPLPSLFPQGLTVSNSTQNAGSHKAHYVNWAEYQPRALNVGNQGPLRRRLAFSPRTSRRSAPPDPLGPAGHLVPAPTLPALFSGR